MTYPYTVKANGKWYPPNTEIPDVEKAEVLDEEKTSEGTDEGTDEGMTEIETENGEAAESEAEKEAQKKKTGAKK